MSAVSSAQALAVGRDFGITLSQATLRKWVQRGKVRSYGYDTFDLEDIAREYRRIAGQKPALT